MISSHTCSRYSLRLIQQARPAFNHIRLLADNKLRPCVKRFLGAVFIGQRFGTHRRQIPREESVMTNQRLCQSTGL
jgi:hypothetical protein